ncbi:MAG: TetR/AcrR family transcriptional regulator [Burkholderiaceae bacterium]
MPTSENPEKTEYHHGNLKRVLMDAALEHLREASVETLAFRGLARRAGVTAGAPYHHFRDRAALLGELATEGFDGLCACMVRVKANLPGVDPRADADTVTLAILRFAREHWGHYKAMFHESSQREQADDPVFPCADQAFTQLTEIVRYFGVPADQAEFRAAEIWAMVHGLLVLSIEGPLHKRLPKEQFEPVACDGVRILLGLGNGQPC